MNGSDAAARTEIQSSPADPKVAGRSWRLSGDSLFHTAAVVAAFLAAATLFATVAAIAFDSRLGIKTFGIWHFIASSEWNPVRLLGPFPSSSVPW
jgi:ABC-type phosphate transport system permease subunit